MFMVKVFHIRGECEWCSVFMCVLKVNVFKMHGGSSICGGILDVICWGTLCYILWSSPSRDCVSDLGFVVF